MARGGEGGLLDEAIVRWDAQRSGPLTKFATSATCERAPSDPSVHQAWREYHRDACV